MRLSPLFAPAAMMIASLAAPQLHGHNSTNSAASHLSPSDGGFIGHIPYQAPTPPLMQRVPKPTPVAMLNDSVSDNTTSWTAIITSIIIVENNPDSWFPFSWGPWMLPPLEDITCSVTSSSTSVPSWMSSDFPWVIPPRRQVLTESPSSTTASATVPQWTESAPGSWGVQPRDGVTCVATSSTSSSRSMTTPIPIWGGGGTSFFWGLPPQDDQTSTDAPVSMPTGAPSDWPTIFVTVVSTATFASESSGSLTSTLIFRSAGEDDKMVFKKQADVTTVTDTETDTFFSTVVSSQLSESDMSPSKMPPTTDTDSNALSSTTSKKAIPTLSATSGPDLITASSAWIDGLPPPIPFDSVILKTLTLDIPDHGTRVADTSTWFGPWPSSTELPFVTSPIISTPTTFLTLPKTTDIGASTSTGSSINCNEEYCGEDGTSYCFYWAGVTTMGQYGPEPGETRVPMGGCSVSAKSVTFVTDLEWKSPQSNGVS